MPQRDLPLPDLGEGLEEAVISAWLVNAGDEVELNQPLVEVETAKATVEIPSPFSGTITKLHAAVGDAVMVGAPLVTFDVEEATPAPTTPAVRKLAKDLGVDLSAVTGTGPRGRITREDVERAADTAVEALPVSTIRRTIAERLTEAARIPQVTTFRTVDCSALEAFRRERGVSPLPIVVRALAEVCKAHPMLNATWAKDVILVHGRVHVGIATDTERGLLVPVVRDADSLGIAAIAAEIDRLANAARDGSITPHDLAGDTITVTNTGSYGSESGTPLLNPPDAVIVGLGVIEPRALVVEGRVEARPACTLSVTFDHRVLDGAAVGRALADLVALLERRERLEALPR